MRQIFFFPLPLSPSAEKCSCTEWTSGLRTLTRATTGQHLLFMTLRPGAMAHSGNLQQIHSNLRLLTLNSTKRWQFICTDQTVTLVIYYNEMHLKRYNDNQIPSIICSISKFCCGQDHSESGAYPGNTAEEFRTTHSG